MDRQEPATRYVFDGYELDGRTLELFRDGQPVRLQRQPAQVLALLIEHAGELVSRDQLRDQIWGGERFVDFDRSLGYCLHQIRAALGDDPRAPRYVETLRGLGFRFIGAVAGPAARGGSTAAEPPPVALGPAPSTPRPAARRVSFAATGLAVAVTVATLWRWGPAAVDLSPSSPVAPAEEVLLQRAGDYYRRDRRDDVMNALTVYRELAALAPGSVKARAGEARALSWLALHHRSADEAQRALSVADAVWRIAPNDPEVVEAHARGLHATGRLTEAAGAYRTALRLDPSRTDLLDHLALIEHQRGRLDEAVRLLEASWRLGGPNATTAGLLGVVLSELGLETDALDWNRLAISLAPDHPESTYSEALLAYQAGRLEEAEARLTAAAAAADPGAALSRLRAVVVGTRYGAAAALAPLEAAAHAMPESPEIQVMLAEVYRAMGRHDDAQRTRQRWFEICRNGLDAAPESPMWPRCLATHAGVVGDREAAVMWYERAVERGWRKLASDRGDGGLALLAGDPRLRATQRRVADDVARMRLLVEKRGVPKA